MTTIPRPDPHRPRTRTYELGGVAVLVAAGSFALALAVGMRLLLG